MNKPLRRIDLVGTDGGVAFVLPADLAARFDVERGGQLWLVECEDGAIRIEGDDARSARFRAVGLGVIEESKDVLDVLAR